MRVALLAPEWDRTCAECERHVHRDDGMLAMRRGLPVLRPPGAPTPCHKCAKVPAAVRESGADWTECRKHARDMTAANRAAWAFYRRCRAVDRFPDDPLVAWCAAVVADVERAAEQVPAVKLQASIELLTQVLLKRGR